MVYSDPANENDELRAQVDHQVDAKRQRNEQQNTCSPREQTEDDSDSDDEDLFGDGNGESHGGKQDDQDQESSKRQRTIQTEETNVSPQPVVTSLHDLITESKWDELVSRVLELRRNAPKDEKILELHEQSEEFLGLTPLQRALQAVADAQVISSLVDTHTVKDRNELLNMNPLLKACEYLRDPECIQTILRYNPEAILDKQDGLSVFHVILQAQPPLQLVEYMVQVWARQKSVDENVAWKEILSDRDDGGMLPIHYAIQEHADSDVVLKLLQEYPGSATETIDGTRSSLSTAHMAVFHGCSYKVLKALVEQGAGPLFDNRGSNNRTKKDTPLHLLFHIDNQKRWLVDEPQAPGVMSPYKMAWFLIMRYAQQKKTSFGSKKANAKDEAYTLVFKVKGQGNYTVAERAKELVHALEGITTTQGYRELFNICGDFENIIARHREFPRIDFDDDE